jgi:predicted transcriptional regulator
MSLLQSFRDRVENFLERTGMAPSRFGKEACNDRRFVFDIREGRSPHIRTIEKVEAYIAAREAKMEPQREREPAT